MDQLTRMLAGLLRCLAGLLGEHRRDWVHALLAETGDLPAPSARLAWLGGGLWLVTREVLMNRIIQALAFAAGAVALVWIGWPGASTNREPLPPAPPPRQPSQPRRTQPRVRSQLNWQIPVLLPGDMPDRL